MIHIFSLLPSLIHERTFRGTIHTLRSITGSAVFGEWRKIILVHSTLYIFRTSFHHLNAIFVNSYFIMEKDRQHWYLHDHYQLSINFSHTFWHDRSYRHMIRVMTQVHLGTHLYMSSSTAFSQALLI